VLEKVLAVLSAVLTLGTGFLAYKTAAISQAKDQAQATATTTTNDLTSLQARYDALQAENTSLKEQLGLPGPSADPQTPTAATVRHSGQLVLATGNNADLDSPSSDPQWSTGSTDIGYSVYADRLDVSNALYLANRKADYATCHNTTGYSDKSFDVGSVAPSKYLCVKTDEKRYSALRITQLDSSKIAFDVVTYDPPDN
jgi:hypothetical protein